MQPNTKYILLQVDTSAVALSSRRSSDSVFTDLRIPAVLTLSNQVDPPNFSHESHFSYFDSRSQFLIYDPTHMVISRSRNTD